MDRRRVLNGALGLGVGASMAGCRAAVPQSTPLPPLDFAALSDAEAFQLYLKTIGSLETQTLYIWFQGVLWGAVPGQEPAAFCGFQGLARHDWVAHGDGRFSQTAYDVGFFSDLETGQPVDVIRNPFTQADVETYHYKYGGAESVHDLERFLADRQRKNFDWRVAQGQATLTERGTGQIKSKFTPEAWPEETSGPINFYGGETSYATTVDALADPKVAAAPYDLFWSGFSPWEPWLKMAGAKGVCQWRATGMKLMSPEAVPETMAGFVRRVQSNYFDAAAPWDGYVSNTDRFIKSRGK